MRRFMGQCTGGCSAKLMWIIPEWQREKKMPFILDRRQTFLRALVLPRPLAFDPSSAFQEDFLQTEGTEVKCVLPHFFPLLLYFSLSSLPEFCQSTLRVADCPSRLSRCWAAVRPGGKLGNFGCRKMPQMGLREPWKCVEHTHTHTH